MRSEDLVGRGSLHPKLETSGDFVRFTRCINSCGCSDDRKIIDHLCFVDRALPISNCGAGIGREEQAFMRSPVGNGSPKSWWTLQLWERAGRSSRSRLVLGVLTLAPPGCMTTGHQSAKSLDPSVRSAPPRGAQNDPPTNQKPTLPGFLENPVVRGQDPGADQEGGSQDAGSAAVVAPEGSAPPLPQPNPPAPAPLVSDLASAPPGFALDPVANPGGADSPASPGSTLAGAAAGRPLGNSANTQLSGLNPIAQSPPA